MKCQEIQALFLAYLDGEITPSEHTLINTHLAGCYYCRQELATTSNLQQQLRQTLTQSAQVTPSPQAWSHLQKKINRAKVEVPPTQNFISRWLASEKLALFHGTKAVHPLFQQLQNWYQRLIPNVSHKQNLDLSNLNSLGDFQMKKQFVFVIVMAFVILAVGILLLPDTTTIVSAQDIIERSAKAQTVPSAKQGILHTIDENCFNLAALDSEETKAFTTKTPYPECTIYEKYTDLATGKHRSVIRDTDTNQIVHVFGQDDAYIYFGNVGIDTATSTVYRSAIPENYQDFWQPFTEESYKLDSQALFEQVQQSLDVEYVGQETWTDGQAVHVLRFNPTFQISAEAGNAVVVPAAKMGDTVTLSEITSNETTSSKTTSSKAVTNDNDATHSIAINLSSLISTMYYDAETYELLETRETIEREGKEVTVGYNRQLVNELLPAETVINWDFSDLPEIKLVDDVAGKHIPFLAFAPKVLSQKEFVAQANFTPYLLSTVPEGYTLQITVVDGHVTYFSTEEDEPVLEEPAGIYTIAYHNNNGDFINFTGPEMFSWELFDSEAAELYKATNGIKFYVMPADSQYSNVAISGAFVTQVSSVDELGSIAVELEKGETEQNTTVKSSGMVVSSMSGISPVSVDDTLVFGFIETPDGLKLNVTSNLPLDEVKALIENLTVVQ